MKHNANLKGIAAPIIQRCWMLTRLRTLETLVSQPRNKIVNSYFFRGTYKPGADNRLVWSDLVATKEEPR